MTILLDRRFSLLTFILTGCLLGGCQPTPPESFQGYAEGEAVRVAAQQAGVLTSLAVQRGDHVQTGAALFSQEHAQEAAAVTQSEALLAQAQAQSANLDTGKRTPEIAVIDAQIADARARLRLSADQLTRQQTLRAKGFISAEALDQVRTQLARDQAHLAEIEAQRSSARLPGRKDERMAAAAQASAAQAQLAQSQVRLAQKSQTSPVTGQVEDSFYRVGEWVGTGQPVLSILPPQNIKVRFFVPETRLAAIHTGESVHIHCDGCGTPIAATIRFIAQQAEYTPPVLYSENNRHRLVYMVEAWPASKDATRLRPGQPVDVTLK
ncbi:MAG: HlyD family efflux transporter periplasmic adaptor subunit [Pseudomonadota bacterium]